MKSDVGMSRDASPACGCPETAELRSLDRNVTALLPARQELQGWVKVIEAAVASLPEAQAPSMSSCPWPDLSRQYVTQVRTSAHAPAWLQLHACLQCI